MNKQKQQTEKSQKKGSEQNSSPGKSNSINHIIEQHQGQAMSLDPQRVGQNNVYLQYNQGLYNQEQQAVYNDLATKLATNFYGAGLPATTYPAGYGIIFLNLVYSCAKSNWPNNVNLINLNRYRYKYIINCWIVDLLVFQPR